MPLATERVHQAILGLPLATQKEIQDLFGLLALGPARRFLAGVPDGWASASAEQVGAFLQGWRHHRFATLQVAYHALHDLVLGAWYADPRAGRPSAIPARSELAHEQPDPRPDPGRPGAGWNVIDGATLQADRTIEADVVIVGSGAGGGVSAEILALAGLKVVIVEEGALKSSRDFKMREAEAYPALYQESAARKTRDKAINILQGRTVGGSTTVNWTSSFRTPTATLEHWQQHFGLAAYTPEALAPWFALMEERLGVERLAHAAQREQRPAARAAPPGWALPPRRSAAT